MQYLIIYKFEFEIIPLAAVFPISASVAVFFFFSEQINMSRLKDKLHLLCH